MKQEQGSETLIEEMKQYLPIPARFTEDSYQYLKQKEIYTDSNREINISNVFYSGDTGGIICTIEGDEKEVLIISLTHLIIKPDHPLSDKIVAYQKKRIKRLRRYR
ncbi:MAG: hypothetical protein ACYDEF_02690 [Methanosarcina sp.]|nr:hypothetical protein BGV40_07280 [Methanosarcina sp. Ant1]